MRNFSLLTLVCACVLALPAAAGAKPGDLDSTYGAGGVVSNIFGAPNSWTYAVTVQPSDGKAIVAGGKGGVGASLERHNLDGSLDATFGSGGIADGGFGLDGGFDDVAVSASGKIAAVGTTSTTPWDWTVALFNSNGTPDTSFSTDGKLTLDFAAGYDVPQKVQFRPDGGIVVVGSATVGGDSEVAIAEWDADGLPTASFSGDGRTTDPISAFDDYAVGLHQLPDGSLVVAAVEGLTANTRQLAILRFLPTGLPDAAFGTGGKTTLHLKKSTSPADLLTASDGKYLIVGDVDGPILGDDGLLAARFNTDGTLDMSYGTGGSTVVPVESVSGRVGTLQLDGKLIIAGEYPVGPHYSASIVRLNTGGTLDGAFGASGIVNRSVPAGTDEEIYGLATQKDGKILVSADSTTSPSGVALMRILDKDPPPVPLTAKISAPTKSKLRAKKFKSFSGTAAGDGLAKVEVAIGLADSKLLKKSKKCLFVTGTSGKTKKFKAVKKKCAPKKWLKATGTTTWSYKFKKKLAPGKYKLYVRAVGAGGAVSAATTKNLKIVK